MLASIVGFTKTSFARISNLSCKGAVMPGQKAGLMLVKTPPSVNTIAPEYIAGLIEGDGSIKVPSTLRSDKGKLILSFSYDCFCG